MKKRVTVKSSFWLMLIVAFLLCAALLKLGYVALAKEVDGVNLKKFAASRNTVTKSLYASRGSIYDSNGDALALSVNSYTLIAYLNPVRTVDPENPKHVVDKDYTAKMLAPILEIDEQTILGYLNKQAYQVEFGTKGRQLTELTKRKIDELELPGIDFIESNQRYYKMGDFASYIIGYAKTNDEGEIAGELGIESYYNNELSGTDGYITYQKDAYGYQLPNVPSYEKEAVSGSDIYLTIDSNIELITENAISDLDDAYDFDFAIMTVMDAQTGAIVASSTSPSFNPNDLNTLESYLNPLVSYAYEPGSTMKIFSWASAIEEGIYDGTATYKSGSIDVADVTIKDFNKTGWGVITYDKGFAYSSNVGASKIALELGTAKLTDYYHRFGFGKTTDINLSGEVPGEIDFTYQSELATASFGQGITITPVQMLQALTAITNNGVMLKPYVVQRIVSASDKTTYEGKRTEVAKVMNESTAKKMQELMYNANYDGLGVMWQPKSVKMSAKTGTAQIASPSGGYLDGTYDNIYSLAGIFPSDQPKYIIYVAVKRIVGSQRAVADMVTKAVDEISSYANITETEITDYENSILKLKNYKSKKVVDVQNDLTSKGLNVYVLGSGEFIIDQFPSKDTKVVKGSKVFLITNKNDYIMPDVLNWSLSEVKTYASLAKINLVYEGYGYVNSQNITTGTALNQGVSLAVSLTEKKQ